MQARFKGVWQIVLAACTTALVLLLAEVFVERQRLQTLQVESENQVREQLLVLQARVESQLNGNIQLARGLVAVIASNPNLDQKAFEQAAQPLFDGPHILRSIAAAPDMVVRMVHPLPGNERVIGLDYTRNAAQRAAAELARDTNSLIVAGPLALVQGGTGLVARIPVFLASPNEPRRFWGLLSVVLDVDQLYRQSGLLDAQLPIEVALRGRDSQGSDGEVFHGDPALFEGHAVTLPIALPSGSWQIAARPRGGWSEDRSQLWPIRLGFALALLLSVVPMSLLAQYAYRRNLVEIELEAHHLHLASLVKERTAELQSAKDAAEASNAELKLFKRFAEESLQGVGMADMGRRAFFHNRRLREMLGLPLAGAPTQDTDFLDCYPPWARDKIQSEVLPAILSRGHWSGELALLNRLTGGITPTLESFTLIRDEQGQPLFIMDLMTDISEQKRTELELTHARDAAEAASRAKSTFLANMSHELRTPLNGIMGMTGLALSMATDDKQRNYLQKVDKASHHLLHLINDILDISRIEAERLTLEHIDFQVGEVIEHLLSLVGHRAAEKSLPLHIDLPAHLGRLHVLGDPVRLGQVLLNLVGNAIKFTQQGHVTLRCRVVDDAPAQLLMRWEVIDTGIGISPADQGRLFTAFEQADGSTTRRYGGSGLGLAISKRLVHLMGGDIGIQSEAGAGSTFWFTMKLDKAATDATSPSQAHAQARTPTPLNAPMPGSDEALLRQRHTGARVLLAEDDPINQEVSMCLLQNIGLRVDLAENGEQAVSWAGNQRYDLILMDMQMPQLNGLDATRAIRSGSLNRDTPILAMTANAFEEDHQRCTEAGMDDHVAKPVDRGQLCATLLKWLERPRQA